MEAVDVRPRGSIQEGTIIAQADTEGVNLSLPRGENGKAIIDHHPIDDRVFSWLIQDLRLEDDGDDDDDDDVIGEVKKRNIVDGENNPLKQVGHEESHRNDNQPISDGAENEKESGVQGLNVKRVSVNADKSLQERYYQLKFKLAVTGET